MNQDNCLIICKNCGEQFATEFCPNCGQNRKADFSQKQILKDYLEEAIGVDDKFWITLKYLLFKPGFLTNEFIQSKRRKYLSPIKLYLLVVFLFFGMQTITESIVPSIKKISENVKGLDEKNKDFSMNNLSFGDSDVLTYKKIVEEGESLGFKPDTRFFTEEKMEVLNIIENGKSKIHWLIFISLPFAALLLKPFYWKYSISQHLIHMINIYTLVFFYSMLDLMLPFRYVSEMIFFLFYLSLIISFKRVYNGSWIGSFFKSVFFIFLFFVVFLIILVIGIVGYFGFHALTII